MGIKEDIDLLDSKVARLKVEYEQYFMRVLKREPAKLREEVEKLILLYSTKNITNTSFKFKYNSIVSKFNSYKQYWNRVLRAIEEGEFYKRPPEEAPVAAGASPAGSDINDLYYKYIEARRACNEPTEGITPEGLKRTVEDYKKKIEERYKTSEVDLKVQIKDGRARLTITPRKG